MATQSLRPILAWFRDDSGEKAGRLASLDALITPKVRNIEIFRPGIWAESQSKVSLLWRHRSPQVAHTVGVMAAWFGRIDVLEHMVERHGVDLSAFRDCFVCLECEEIALVRDCKNKDSGRWQCENLSHDPSNKETVAHAAAAGGHVPVLEYLNAHKAALKTADEVIRLHFCTPACISPVNIINCTIAQDGLYPVMFAASQGRLDALKWFLDAGIATPNIIDNV